MEKAIQNKNDPMEIYKQITSKNSPEQMNMFYKKVEQMGFPSEIINKLKG
jgi:negative regulator of replication initiation